MGLINSAKNLFSESKVVEIKQPSFSIAFPNTQALKGEIEKSDENRFDKSLGEEHPFDYKVPLHTVKEFGMLHGAVDKIVNFVWGPGFFTASENARAKEIIDQWMQDTNFADHGRKWLKQSLVKGFSPMEMGGNIKQSPQGIKTLKADNVFVKRDSKGKVEGYNQLLQGNVGKPIKVINFKPYQIAALNINQFDDEPYGVGVVYPNLKAIDSLLGLQLNLNCLMKRKANSPIVVKLGNAEKDIIPTAESVEAFAGKLTYMNSKTEWVVDANTDVSTLDFPNFSEKFDGPMKHYEDLLFFGLQVPEVLMGRGNIPEGLAKEQREAFDRYIQSIQSEIEKVIETKIFTRILQANGLDTHVEFEWGQPSQEEVNLQITQITTLLQNPSLNIKLREELEKKLADSFGINPESIILDDSERVEDETKENPRVPGDNQQSLTEGDLIDHDLSEYESDDSMRQMQEASKEHTDCSSSNI